MIRHVAVFRFTPEFTAEHREDWMGMLRRLPHQIPEIRRMSVGVDVLGGPASYEMAVVADFDDLDGLAAYTRHPAHEEVLRVSAGVKESLATVDFVIEDPE